MTAQTAFWYGFTEKNRIIEAMRANSAIYLTTLRSFAREHALRHGEVCIDDVRQMIAERQFPMPKEIGCPSGDRVFGAVFSCKDFIPVRQILTRRAERLGRSGRGSSYIWTYRLREATR